MKCVAFDHVIPVEDDVDSYWAWAMHDGVARRVAAKYPAVKYFQGDDCVHPVHLARCLDEQPDVIVPSGFFLVADAVKKKLACVKTLKFLPVVVSKSFSLKRQGRKNVRNVRSLEELYDLYSDEGCARSKLPIYWEVVCYRGVDVSAKYKTRHLKIHIPGQSENEVPLSAEMMRDYQWVRDMRYIVTADVFDIIQPHLDQRFFKSVAFKV